MMEETGNSICREGIVRKIKDDEVTVEITMKSACAGCHAKSMCMLSESKQEFIQAKSLYPDSLAVGDEVEISMKRSMGGKAVLIGYFFPFLVMMIVLFLAYGLTGHEAVAVLLSIAAMAIYYLIVWKFNKKLNKQFVFYAKRKL